MTGSMLRLPCFLSRHSLQQWISYYTSISLALAVWDRCCGLSQIQVVRLEGYPSFCLSPDVLFGDSRPSLVLLEAYFLSRVVFSLVSDLAFSGLSVCRVSASLAASYGEDHLEKHFVVNSLRFLGMEAVVIALS